MFKGRYVNKNGVLNSFISGLSIILLFCSFSLSALTLEQLQQQLTADQLLRGDFSQSKTLKIFDQPLVSTGTFLLSHQKGLIWQQQQPFSVLLVLANEKLRQQFADQPSEIIEAKDNPMVFYFSHLFLSLFKGDLSALDEKFALSLNDASDGWMLLLKPKSAPLNKVFEKIEISGKKQINQLNLIELNGDATTIDFMNISTKPLQLTEQEADVFQF